MSDIFQPIFIVGNSRSGTTLLSNILRRNKDVYSFNELHFFEKMVSLHHCEDVLTINEAIILGAKLMAAAREGQIYTKHFHNYLNETKDLLSKSNAVQFTAIEFYKMILLYKTQINNKIIPCEQTPNYIYYISEILNLIPSARFIQMIRDPRDVLLSRKNKWKRYKQKNKQKIPVKETLRTWASYHPILNSKLWHSAVKAGNKFIEDDRVIKINFEALILNPESVIRDLCVFLKIEFCKDMLDVPKSKSPTFRNTVIKNGISNKAVGRWKRMLKPVDIYWCQKINNSLMKASGYSVEKISVNMLFLLFSSMSLLFKMGLMFLLNLNETAHLLTSIKKRLA